MEVQIKNNKIFAPLKDKWLVLAPAKHGQIDQSNPAPGTRDS